MLIQEAINDKTSPIKSFNDIDDIVLNYVKTKGFIVGCNEKEGRSKIEWFSTQKKAKDFIDGKTHN